jgi:hypothetical protein
MWVLFCGKTKKTPQPYWCSRQLLATIGDCCQLQTCIRSRYTVHPHLLWLSLPTLSQPQAPTTTIHGSCSSYPYTHSPPRPPTTSCKATQHLCQCCGQIVTLTKPVNSRHGHRRLHGRGSRGSGGGGGGRADKSSLAGEIGVTANTGSLPIPDEQQGQLHQITHPKLKTKLPPHSQRHRHRRHSRYNQQAKAKVTRRPDWNPNLPRRLANLTCDVPHWFPVTRAVTRAHAAHTAHVAHAPHRHGQTRQHRMRGMGMGMGMGMGSATERGSHRSRPHGYIDQKTAQSSRRDVRMNRAEPEFSGQSYFDAARL